MLSEVVNDGPGKFLLPVPSLQRQKARKGRWIRHCRPVYFAEISGFATLSPHSSFQTSGLNLMRVL